MRVMSGVVGLLLVGAGAGETQTRNAELGYSFTPPEGFSAYPEGRVQEDVVECWTETTAASADGAIVLCVQRLHGTIGRESLTPEELASRHLQRTTFKWKGFDIEGVRGAVERNGVTVIGLIAQVPLRHEAIQLIVSTPQDQEARASVLLATALQSLDGESNWLTPAERSERLGRIAGLAAGIAVALVAIRLWRQRRRARSA